jgi:hypothetical protein
MDEDDFDDGAPSNFDDCDCGEDTCCCDLRPQEGTP